MELLHVDGIIWFFNILGAHIQNVFFFPKGKSIDLGSPGIYIYTWNLEVSPIGLSNLQFVLVIKRGLLTLGAVFLKGAVY